MAVATKNNSGIPLADPAVRCPGPHVDIFRHDVFLEYLMNELECTDAAGNPLRRSLNRVSDEAPRADLGPARLVPRARAYVPFERLVPRTVCTFKPSGPTVVHLLGKLLPVYCRLCLLSECHDWAKIAAQALLARLTVSKDLRDEVAQFEIRTLVYMIDNLSATLPSEWGEVCQSTDVSAETKIAVELLWCHLALVYAGNRKLLLCNLELFSPDPKTPEPVSKRTQGRPIRARSQGKNGHSEIQTPDRHTPTIRVSNVPPLLAGGSLDTDAECNKGALHWLYKPGTAQSVTGKCSVASEAMDPQRHVACSDGTNEMPGLRVAAW
ncbi:hypothetical protein DPEC_G00379080 [Dallia pectoralis]|nr:hypothetical protein DPEC_G00379080 [Dallia pectoralis]